MEIIAIIATFTTAIVLFSAPVVGIVLIAYFYTRNIQRRNALRAELCSKALEKGMELPPNLFAGEVKPKNPQRAFNAGVICMAIGLGIVLTFAITGVITDRKTALINAALGLIPMLIGVACFVIYVTGKKQQHEQA
ncbi:MAG: DUF6249 domain-containing protein [Prevotellaceae bacterium]|jgi:hypothetical protein|nr:DUF6249 domain-containing protein [Prevotellaceae bacterium]